MLGKRTLTGRFVLSTMAAVLFAMSPEPTAHGSTPPPRRDINAVLADNDQRLLALDGVAGVYVGLLKDGRTPCLRVMLKTDSPAVRKAIPTSIEGYPVVCELTGEIHPLREK